MADGSWDKFIKRVQDDVTPPAARPRPKSGKAQRPAPEAGGGNGDGDGRGRAAVGEQPAPPRKTPRSTPRRAAPDGVAARPKAEQPRKPEAPSRPSEMAPPRRPPGKPETRPVRRPEKAERPDKPDKPPKADDGSIRSEIVNQARVVPLDKLRKGGTQFVRVIDPATIERIVGDSVRRALQAQAHTLTSEERAAIEREATAGFAQLMSEHKKLLAENSQLQAEKSAADQQREQLERQVADLRSDLGIEQRRLAEERERQAQRAGAAPAGRLDGEALERMGTHLHEVIQRMVQANELCPPGFMTPPDGIPQFARALDEVIDSAIAARRKSLTSAAALADGVEKQAVELLERRIAKLTRALEETERQLTPFEAHRPVSAFTEVQGISDDEPGYKWRSAILRMVFLESLELRKLPISEHDRTGPFPGKRLLESLQRAAEERAQAKAVAGW